MTTRLAWIAVFAAAALTAGAESTTNDANIWIEAEDFTGGTFVPAAENPYAPREFWEEAVLSGGKWVGLQWMEPGDGSPFLELTFDAPRADTYHLYVRQFYSFAGLRWKVDGGDWVKSPEPMPAPLDFVAMRELPGDRVSLNWFSMGKVKLSQGRHKLRVEPIFRKRKSETGHFAKDCPVGYDAFLLTTGLFFPSGGDRPGQTQGKQTAETFSTERSIDSFAPSPMDWRSLNEKFAGASGGITTLGGKLVFRDSGLPVRLFGVNVSMEAFGEDRALPHLARLLAKLGVNLVRMDIAPIFRLVPDEAGSLRFEVVPEKLKSLVNAIEAFRAEGIYAALTWHMSNTAGVADHVFLVEQPAVGGVQLSLMPVLLFDPKLQKAVEKAWGDLLAAPLADGHPLGTDPCLAMITLMQQETIFSRGAFDVFKTVPSAREPMELAFGRWLAKSNLASDEVLAGWKKEASAGDDSKEARIGVQTPEEMALWRDERARVTARFLAESQREYLRGLADALRMKSGYKGLISGSNRTPADPAVLGWLNQWSLGEGDIHERQATFSGHFEATRDIWIADPGARFQNRSAVRLDALPGNEPARFDFPLRAFSYGGHPTVISEISWPLPNRFRPEMVPLASALSQLQGVEAVVFSMVRYPHWQSFMPSPRLDIFTPGVLGQFPAFAYAFRNGLFPTGSDESHIQVSEKAVFSLDPAPVPDNPDCQASLPALAANPPVPEGVHPLFWLGGRTVVGLAAGTDGGKFPTLARADSTSVTTAGGRLSWDFGKGIFTVNAPSVRMACGFLGEAGEMSLGALRVRLPIEFGVICAVAIDDNPLESSSRILVQVFSEEANQGTFSEGDEIKTLLSAGRPPISIHNLSGNVEIVRPDAGDFVVTALDPNGYKKLVVSVGGRFTLLPSTMYYLLEK